MRIGDTYRDPTGNNRPCTIVHIEQPQGWDLVGLTLETTQEYPKHRYINIVLHDWAPLGGWNEGDSYSSQIDVLRTWSRHLGAGKLVYGEEYRSY